jgi:hypothetical protein
MVVNYDTRVITNAPSIHIIQATDLHGLISLALAVGYLSLVQEMKKKVL